jgi:hypothetical protein
MTGPHLVARQAAEELGARRDLYISDHRIKVNPSPHEAWPGLAVRQIQ